MVFRLVLQKRAISPLIATILLVIVAVAIIGIIISWGKGFTNDSLSNTTNIANLKVNDATHFVFEPKINGSLLTFRYSPPQNLKNETITITGYSVPGSLEIVSLTENVILTDGYVGIEGLNLSSFDINLNNTDLILITDNNGFITLNKINLLNYIEPPPILPSLISSEGILLYGYPQDVNGGLYGDVWGCHGTEIGINAQSSSDGKLNTSTIVNNCLERPISASMCDDLDVYGFDDWYLPSVDQLIDVVSSLPNRNNTMDTGDFELEILAWMASGQFSGIYATSTETSSTNAFLVGPKYLELLNMSKTSTSLARCVRDDN